MGQGIRLRIGPMVTQLQVRFPNLAQHVHFLYKDTPFIDEPCIVDFEVKLAPPPALRRWFQGGAAIYLDGIMNFGPFDPAIAMPMLEWCLNGCVFNRPNQYLILHSAVIERDGRAAILPAPPGTGKSTLCAAMSLRGWRLLSDEVAMIRPSDKQLLPVPRPVGLKEGSIDVIKRFEPTAAVGHAWPGTRKGTVAHMRPPADHVARADEPATPAWIICPRYEADAATTFEPIPKADALLYVAHDAFNYSLLGTTGFETFADIVDACDCYALVYSDLNEAVGVFNALTPPRATAHPDRS